LHALPAIDVGSPRDRSLADAGQGAPWRTREASRQFAGAGLESARAERLQTPTRRQRGRGMIALLATGDHEENEHGYLQRR